MKENDAYTHVGQCILMCKTQVLKHLNPCAILTQHFNRHAGPITLINKMILFFCAEYMKTSGPYFHDDFRNVSKKFPLRQVFDK